MARISLRLVSALRRDVRAVRAVRRFALDITKEVRRRARMVAVCTSREVRRRYQKELRAAAPVRSRRLRRSIRVFSRARGQVVNVRVQMIFYGFLINSYHANRSQFWATNVRNRIANQARSIIVTCFSQIPATRTKEPS